MVGQIERTTVRLPASFDENNPAHLRRVLAAVSASHGSGFEIESVDLQARRATAIRSSGVARTEEREGFVRIGNLPSSMRTPTAGQKVATMYEDKYQEQGLSLTRFDPFIGVAELEKLPDDVKQCRGAVAAALGVKPWDITSRKRSDGGFEVQLRSYIPSKHEAKLQEVASSIVGQPGWYVTVDTTTNVAQFIPADLPTFEARYPYPFGRNLTQPFVLPVGIALGGNGLPNAPLDVDCDGSSGILVSGLGGAGKSNLINGFVFGALASHGWLAVIDVAHKNADFEWCRDLVHENWWGCDSKADALTVLRLVYAEGKRRGRLISEHGVQKWQELPEAVRAEHPPIWVVADEVQGLFSSDPIPKRLPKDHSLRVEAEQAAMETEMLQVYASRLPAEMRFVGIRMIEATQQAQTNTGVSPTAKLNLPNRFLVGANPTKQARGHALQNPDAVPEVPEWVRADTSAARGSGVAELEGLPPTVFKSFLASVDEYRRRLLAAGVPRTDTPAPTASQRKQMVPSMHDDYGPDERPASGLDSGGFGQPDGRDIAERDGVSSLKGAARAAHELRVQEAQFRSTQQPDPGSAPEDRTDEVIAALLGLGWTQQQASAAIRQVLSSAGTSTVGPDQVSQVLNAALKYSGMR